MTVLTRRLLGERFGALTLLALERAEQPTPPGTGGPDRPSAQLARCHRLGDALGYPIGAV